MDPQYDLIIVGSGAAGLSAAIYAGRYRMRVLLVNGEFGGETATAGAIWNYPGVKGVDGYDLMKVMREQAEEVGTTFIDGMVSHTERVGGCFEIRVGEKKIASNTLIFAIGTSRRHLGLPREKELTGRGVHYCMTCDGPLYTGKKIAVVGGGDASVKGINLAGEYADHIYFIVRDPEIVAEPINLEQMQKLGEKITVLTGTEVKEIIGSGKLEKILLNKEIEGSAELPIDGLFVEIGAEPKTAIAEELGVAVDKGGYIVTDAMARTNVPGVFAAGDAVNFFGRFKQDITAACLGAVAATSAYEYKKLHGDLCELHGKPLEEGSVLVTAAS